jgi:ABC-type Mn2+/Zn2+ transport system ATPase subunit
LEKRKGLLSLNAVDLTYGGHSVLKNVNLGIEEGDFWFLVGPNGEGNTTLLRAILGEIRPVSGEVWLSSEIRGKEFLGLVPQHSELNPTLSTTVRELVSLGLVGVRADRGERKERLHWALERVGLERMETKDFRTLSGGQRQRVLVARALIRRPRLLLVDEPTRGLDLSSERRFLDLLLDLNRQDRLTILFVAHDLSLAARHSTHVALFFGGHVMAGRTRDVLTTENLRRAYGIPVSMEQLRSGFGSPHAGAGGSS